MIIDEMGSRKQSQTELSWPCMIYNILIHLLLWLFFGYIGYLSVTDIQLGKMLFSWHPPLLALGSILMSESIMCFSNENILTYRLDHKGRVRAHWMLQVIAAILTMAGFVVVVVHKFNFDKHHFRTNHALYGLIAVIGTAFTMGGGVWALYSYQLRGYLRPVHAKILHSAVALINYLLMTVTVLLGFYSSWYGKHGSVLMLYVCFVMVLFVAQYIMYRPVVTLTSRVRGVWMRAYEL